MSFPVVLKQKGWPSWLRYHSAGITVVGWEGGRWSIHLPRLPPIPPLSRVSTTAAFCMWIPVLRPLPHLPSYPKFRALIDDQRMCSPFASLALAMRRRQRLLMNWYSRKRTEDTLLFHPSHFSLGVLSHLSVPPPKFLPKRQLFSNHPRFPLLFFFRSELTPDCPISGCIGVNRPT